MILLDIFYIYTYCFILLPKNGMIASPNCLHDMSIYFWGWIIKEIVYIFGEDAKNL